MNFTVLKIRLLMMLAPALAGVLWLGWSSGGAFYEKTPAEVQASLMAAHVPVHVLGEHVKSSHVTAPDERTVITALLDENSNELMRFVTTIEPDGTGSFVDTEIIAPEGENAERARGAMQQNALAVNLLEMVAEEHVASAIDGRAFNMLALNPAANAMVQAQPELAAQIDQANRSADEWSRIEQDSFSEPVDDGWNTESDYAAHDWGS
ncbi:hypothetical protein [Aurantiacibacter poecillastricola]|uniref:hypothetical protein n=1 Tax=Aurantiacibacter poecillastricola TaxID=3064385 RepID=UPI00273D4DF9|nr:hypothetical protein [Aurantiacibacter sp. 219JJ12-13]MDP5260338.1 hypothetical protein [Aurantiacibacter sp. 219JJ12-13]